MTLELLMLGRALDFIHFVNKRLGITLGTDEGSVELFEEVIDAVGRGIVQEELFADGAGSIAKSMSAYLGLLILANIGGEWTDTENGVAVDVNGREAFVYEYMEKRLLGLSETSVTDYYESVRIVK